MTFSHRSRLLVLIAVLVVSALACQQNFAFPPTATTDPHVALTANAADIAIEAEADRPPAEPQPTLSSVGTAPNVSSGDLLAQQEALIALYENVSPGVVSILVGTETGGGSGSGFVIDNEGHIATNYHVIDGATEIQVNFTSGVKARGEIVGTDTDSDLAIIKVDVDPKWLHPLALGDSSVLKVGQIVVAIGNPFGLTSSMTTGIVSSLGRTLDSLSLSSSGQTFTAGDIIQTDAAINPGNSGGPLLNLNGEVIGINRAIRTFSTSAENEPLNSGVGFSISVNILKRVAPSLIQNGYYDYPYLGVSSLQEMPLEVAEQLGLERAIGAVVTDVVSGGPAEDAGVEVGDVILWINNLEVTTFGNLIGYLFTETSPGDTVELTILRDGGEITIDLVLGRRP
jgi:2-alkenal reductase